MDSYLILTGFIGFLINAAIALVWSTEPFIFALCSGLAIVYIISKKDKLIQYSHPHWVILKFEISCALLLYFTYSSCNFVFLPIGSYISFDVSYYLNRLRCIATYARERSPFSKMLFFEVFFHISWYYLGSYYALILDLLLMISIIYKEVYFGLAEEHLQTLTNLFCFAILPAIAVCFYGLKVITTVVLYAWNSVANFACFA